MISSKLQVMLGRWVEAVKDLQQGQSIDFDEDTQEIQASPLSHTVFGASDARYFCEGKKQLALLRFNVDEFVPRILDVDLRMVGQFD